MLRPADTIPLTRLEAHLTDDSYTVHTRHVNGDQETLWRRDVRCLGRGSFGEVYREECIEGPERGTLRAVKLIQKPHSPGLRRIDFSRELEAIARFSLPAYDHYFVKALGWYETSDTVFIATEFLEYGDLQQYAGSSLPEVEMHLIASQVLQGLSFMHSQGYAHRDLKPQNLLVHHPSPRWQIKIADFGLSKRVAESVSSLRTHAGTQGYMAPEVLGLLDDDDDSEYTDSENDLAPSYSNAVDIWALGVITFYMLTKRLPFPAMNLRPLKRYVRGKTLFPIEDLRKLNISDAGCTWIESCMSPSPRDRPSAGSGFHRTWKVDAKHVGPASTASVSRDTFDSEASASWRAVDSVYETEHCESMDWSMRSLAMSSSVAAAVSPLRDPDHETMLPNAAVADDVATPEQDKQSPVAPALDAPLSGSKTDLSLEVQVEGAQDPAKSTVLTKAATLQQDSPGLITTSPDTPLTKDLLIDSKTDLGLEVQAEGAQDPAEITVLTKAATLQQDPPGLITTSPDTQVTKDPLIDSKTDLGLGVQAEAAQDPVDITVLTKAATPKQDMPGLIPTTQDAPLTDDLKASELDAQARPTADFPNMQIVSDSFGKNLSVGPSREVPLIKSGYSVLIRHIALSADNTVSGSICSNGLEQSQIWLEMLSTETGEFLQKYDLSIAASELRQRDAFGSLVLGPAGSCAALLTKSGRIHVWHMTSEGASRHSTFSFAYIQSEYDVHFDHLELSGDGKVLAHFGAAVTMIYDLVTMSLVHKSEIGRTTLGSRAMTPDGLYIVYVLRTNSYLCGSDQPHFWRVDTSENQSRSMGGDLPCTTLTHGSSAWAWWSTPLFSLDGKRMCIIGTCSSRIFELSSGRSFNTNFCARSAGINNYFCGRPAFSSDGKWLAWLDTPKKKGNLALTIHAVKTGGAGTLNLPEPVKWKGLGFSPDGVLVVVGIVPSGRSPGLSEVMYRGSSRSNDGQMRVRILLVQELDLIRKESNEADDETRSTETGSLRKTANPTATTDNSKLFYQRHTKDPNRSSTLTMEQIPTVHDEIAESEAETCGWLEHMAVSVDNKVIGAICASEYTPGVAERLRTTLHLWSTFTGKTLYKQDLSDAVARCSSHQRVYHHSLAIGPKASCVALINAARTLHVWRVENDRSSHQEISLPQSFMDGNLWSGTWSSHCCLNDGPHLEFSTDGKSLACHAHETCIYDCRDMSLRHVVPATDIGKTRHGYRRISPDGRVIAYIDREPSRTTLDQLRLWNVEIGSRQSNFLSGHARHQGSSDPEEIPSTKAIEMESSWLTRPLFSQDGRRMCIASKEAVNVWNLSSGRCLRIVGFDAGSSDFDNPSSRIALSYDGRVMAALITDRNIEGLPCSKLTLYNMENGVSVTKKLPADLRCLRLVFRHDNVLLLIGYLQSVRISFGGGFGTKFWLGEEGVKLEYLLVTPTREFGFLQLDNKTSPTTDDLRNLFVPTEESVEAVREMFTSPDPVARPSERAVEVSSPIPDARPITPIPQPVESDDSSRWWNRFKGALLR